jgi:hypothetical protein
LSLERPTGVAGPEEIVSPAAVRHNGMNSAPQQPFSTLKRPGEGSALDELLRWLARSLAIMAVVSTAALLLVSLTPRLTSLAANIVAATPRAWATIATLPLSALPLLLAGSGYIVMQALLRPRPLELLKRLMLGGAFLLWGVVQLMPISELANELGNVVIAMYVVDLALIIRTDLQRA